MDEAEVSVGGTEEDEVPNKKSKQNKKGRKRSKRGVILQS